MLVFLTDTRSLWLYGNGAWRRLMDTPSGVTNTDWPTPAALTADGGAVTIGNGSLTGTWVQAGRIIHAQATLSIGSGTNLASGPLKLMLPQPSTGQGVLGVAHYRLTGTGDYVPGLLVASGTDAARVLAPTGNAGSGIGGSGFAAGGFIRFAFTYMKP
jgi:hypothetical protein